MRQEAGAHEEAARAHQVEAKAETLGADPEALEAVLSAEGSAQAETLPARLMRPMVAAAQMLDAEEDLAGDILEAWNERASTKGEVMSSKRRFETSRTRSRDT